MTLRATAGLAATLIMVGATCDATPVAPAQARSLPTTERLGVGEGRGLFVRWCKPCHGESGRGDGINASTLTPSPADLTSVEIRGRSRGEIEAFVSQGARASGKAGAMPPFGATLAAHQIRDLEHYVRHLQKKAGAAAESEK